MTDDATVIENKAEGRFELRVANDIAIAAYRMEGDAIVFTHTGVPETLEGQGIASRLVAGALDHVRAAGLRMVPACSFVRAYVERHPEARDLLA